VKHKSSAHRQKNYQCDQCGFQTKSKSSLLSHALIHTDHRPIACEHPGCMGRFKNLQHLKDHARSHNATNYECNLCNKLFKSYLHIKNHMAVHSESMKRFKCDLCPRIFLSNFLLKVHRRASHTGQKMYNCKQCPNSYTRHSALSFHKKSAHLKIRYQCKHCDKQFAKDKSLFEHLFTHRGDKPVSFA
jgi:uncharacterized Zn-finger protein